MHMIKSPASSILTTIRDRAIDPVGILLKLLSPGLQFAPSGQQLFVEPLFRIGNLTRILIDSTDLLAGSQDMYCKRYRTSGNLCVASHLEHRSEERRVL